MNVSVIDIGSNTVKAAIFGISDSGRRTSVAHRGFKAKLVSFVTEENGERILSDDGKRVLYSSIEELVDFSERYSCESIYAFATASLRNISNSDEIISYIMEHYSIEVDILSGEEEAMCSLSGLLGDECLGDAREGIMIDMGGGSTEIVYFANGKKPHALSLPFGCLSLYNGFVSGNVPTADERKKAEEYISSLIADCGFVKNIGAPVFLIGGSARAVAKLAGRKGKSNTLRPDGSDFERIIEKMNDSEVFSSAEKLVPGRSLTVTPAAIAYALITDFIKPVSIIVSESGVREGYLEKILP